MSFSDVGMAVLSGFLSFFSPCVFPLLPGYLSFISGVSLFEAQKNALKAGLRAVYYSFFFCLGFTLIFTLSGISASFLGKFIRTHLDLLYSIGGIIVIIFGLHFIGYLKVPLLEVSTQREVKARKGTALGSFLLGLSFATAWTPCTGPYLGVLLAKAANYQTAAEGGLLLLFYSIAFTVPLMVLALFIGQLMSIFKKITPLLRAIEVIGGVILVVVGYAMNQGFLNNLFHWG